MLLPSYQQFLFKKHFHFLNSRKFLSQFHCLFFHLSFFFFLCLKPSQRAKVHFFSYFITCQLCSHFHSPTVNPPVYSQLRPRNAHQSLGSTYEKINVEPLLTYQQNWYTSFFSSLSFFLRPRHLSLHIAKPELLSHKTYIKKMNYTMLMVNYTKEKGILRRKKLPWISFPMPWYFGFLQLDHILHSFTYSSFLICSSYSHSLSSPNKPT